MDGSNQDLLSYAYTGGNIAFKTYMAYKGYAESVQMWGQFWGQSEPSFTNFMSSLTGSTTVQQDIGVKTITYIQPTEGTNLIQSAKNFSNFYNTATENNPALAAVGRVLSVASSIYTGYSLTQAIACGSSSALCCAADNYELACKVRARLCLFAGKYKFEEEGSLLGQTKEYKVQAWMCYHSQIARVINEYGLPQIYDPHCHAEFCDGASVNRPRTEVTPTHCGCNKAYAEKREGRKFSADDLQEFHEKIGLRYRGFTIDQFERLDFDQIPIADEVLRLVMAELPGFETGEIAPGDNFESLWEETGFQDNILIQPSEFDVMAGEGAIMETAETTVESLAEGQDVPHFGQCGELMQEVPENTTWFLDICKRPPGPHMPYYYYFFIQSKVPPCYSCAQEGKKPLDSSQCPDCLRSYPAYCEGQPYRGVTSDSLIDSHVYKEPESYGISSIALFMKIPQRSVATCVELPVLEHLGGTPGARAIQGIHDLYSPEALASASDNTGNYQDEFVSFQPIFVTREYNPEYDSTFAMVSSHAVSKTAIERSRLLQQDNPDYLGVVWREKLQEWFGGRCTPEQCTNWLNNNTVDVPPVCRDAFSMMLSHYSVKINQNCEIMPVDATYNTLNDMLSDNVDATLHGKNWIAILRGCSAGDSICTDAENFLKSHSAYFTECPSFKEDICFKECGVFDEMVCGRPSRANEIAYNVFYYAGRRGDYESYIQEHEFRRRFGLIFNAVSDLYPCSCH